MAPALLASIDFSESESRLKELSYLGHVFATVSPTDSPEAIKFLHKNFARFSIHFDVTQIESLNDIEDLLDAGAAKAFVTLHQYKLLLQNISSERLVISIDSDGVQEVQSFWLANPAASQPGIHFRDGYQASSGFKVEGVYVSDPNAVGSVTSGLNSIPIIPASQITTDPGKNAGLLAAATLLLRNAVPDQSNGLYATNVSDEQGVSLGLVWSSKESVAEALRTGTGVYQSRKRGLWYKGQSSGDTQELIRIGLDCDCDCLQFIVKQSGRGFCHTGDATCFGPYRGLSQLMKLLEARKVNAPPGSYTARLYNEPKLVQAKIMEEAEELCQASTKEEIASEAADLLYFALTKCTAAGVSLADIETNLDLKHMKVKRRKGDAKGPWAEKVGLKTESNGVSSNEKKEDVKETASIPKAKEGSAGVTNGKIQMERYTTASSPPDHIAAALQRPSQKSNEMIMNLVSPIIKDVRENGDAAVLKYTHKFEKATSLTSPVLNAPYPESLMQLPPETIEAINVSFQNIKRFHSAQKEEKPLSVETMPGVVCSRFSRPIERVGLYVPGGTAVLPSTALMLGVPAQVAGCKKIVLASPPRSDGSVTPEIVYIAHMVGAESIVLAGGAQAIAAMAYGTESISKVDKILGPGNQFVTAAKMIVSNDTSAGVSIDMPAGPSEVLVIADKTANPAFVASDLLSQAEHGTDSQVILIAVDLDEKQLAAIEEELHAQAMALPRVDIVRGAIDHSVTFVVKDIKEALVLSNQYAPEHLILQVENAPDIVSLVQNAGSVFIGPWTPESVGDYSAGVNHSLPTYGYARQYSGVNLGSFTKHITSSNLTSEGLRNVSSAVMQLAEVEGLHAHKRAVSIRMDAMIGRA